MSAEIARFERKGEIADLSESPLYPVMMQMAEAMERMAASQQVLTAKVAELEKQIRLKTPLSRSQERCVNDAIRARAKELCAGRGIGGDGKAVTRVAAMIRKAVLARYGVGSLREAPGYDYEIAMEMARRWCDIPQLMAAVREARARAAEEAEGV